MPEPSPPPGVSLLDRTYRTVRPLLFRIDAERAHVLALALLRAVQAVLARHPVPPPTTPRLAQQLAGLSFPNPVGLAAGLDKNGRAPHVWPWLGFGFAELGTVTARAQPGNPKPRLFRIPEERALINRMGFNNDGAEAIARRLKRLRRRPLVPLGINIGRSRAVPPGGVLGDYRQSFRRLAPLADYVAVNVSSPNTPGLRELQEEGVLDALLGTLQEANHALPAPRPLFVKVAPDLPPEGLVAVAAACRRRAVAGIIATNTTTSRSGLRADIAEAGGLSGAPLRERSLAVLRALYQAADGELLLISVGGIFSARDVLERIRAGASLVQLYTALVYEGPALPWRICSELETDLAREGIENVREAVGQAA